MAYVPENARSELVTPANFSDGGVFETTRRFQDASPASLSPARRPTRGSGEGATVDMLLPEDAHAATDNHASVSAADRMEAGDVTANGIVDSCVGTSGRVRGDERITGRAPRRPVWRASSACGRSRWTDRRRHQRRTGRRFLALLRPDRTADSDRKSVV